MNISDISITVTVDRRRAVWYKRFAAWLRLQVWLCINIQALLYRAVAMAETPTAKPDLTAPLSAESLVAELDEYLNEVKTIRVSLGISTKEPHVKQAPKPAQVEQEA